MSNGDRYLVPVPPKWPDRQKHWGVEPGPQPYTTEAGVGTIRLAFSTRKDIMNEVEAVARALATAEGRNPDEGSSRGSDGHHDGANVRSLRFLLLRAATAAISEVV